MTTHSTTSSMDHQRIKVIIGCIGTFIGVVAAIIIFFLIWKRKELKHQGLPRILQESNSPSEERDSAPPLPVKFQNGHTQRDSLIPLIRKRNSSYRSQLSSSASGGTVLTFADGMLSYYHHLDFKGVSTLTSIACPVTWAHKVCWKFLRIISEMDLADFPTINNMETTRNSSLLSYSFFLKHLAFNPTNSCYF